MNQKITISTSVSLFISLLFFSLCICAHANETEHALLREIVAPLVDFGVSIDHSGSLVLHDEKFDAIGPLKNVTDYAQLVDIQTFDEIHQSPQGEAVITVEGEIWTRAIQAALDEHQKVFIPHREKPYYLDAPLLLRSGYALQLDEQAELRLKPGSNCCMVRNEHLLSGHEGPLKLAENPDKDIRVSGGIWTTLATSVKQNNGNLAGWADSGHSLRSHGTLLFSNVEGLRVSGITIRECKPHAIQISNCQYFVVEGIRFENHRRDGVHINGPAAYGVIRDVRNAIGSMGDDMVALNAWDWKNTSMTFGPIHHLLIEDIDGDSAATTQLQHDRRSEIRLLAGSNHFDNGEVLACDIEHCVLRNIRGIRTFKMYDQPNLELGRDNDFADPIGNLRNLHFSDIDLQKITKEPLFQIALNSDGITIHDVSLGFDPVPANASPYVLLQAGPNSQTYKHNPNDPNTWVEIFSPDKDCSVKNLSITNLRYSQNANGELSREQIDPHKLVKVVTQEVNKDYPNTTPRGGTGQGFLEWRTPVEVK